MLFRSLAALRKGSSASSTLQACASRLAITFSDLCVEPYFLHAPGDTLIAEGIDDASRSLARGIKGPSCNQTLKTYIFASAKRLGWHISVDAFASAYNRLVERYYAEFPEPDAEAVDALAVTDWNSSVCPSCGRPHREVVFAFPPKPLVQRFVDKARADGIRAIVLVPASIMESYWSRLLSAAVGGGPEPYRKFRNPMSLLNDVGEFKATALALFTVDFGSGHIPGSDAAFAPRCGREAALRGRPRLGSPADHADRERIRLELRRRFRHDESV